MLTISDDGNVVVQPISVWREEREGLGIGIGERKERKGFWGVEETKSTVCLCVFLEVRGGSFFYLLFFFFLVWYLIYRSQLPCKCYIFIFLNKFDIIRWN